MYKMVKLDDEYIHSKNLPGASHADIIVFPFSESYTYTPVFSRCPYMDKTQPKLDAILCMRAMYLLQFCFCPKMASQAISEDLILKHFLGEHAPRPP